MQAARSRSAGRAATTACARRRTPREGSRHAGRHRRGGRDGCPPGLGSYAEKADRLDARLAFALMGIQAVKGVEIGDGFALARVRGSEAHDEIDPGLVRRTNHAGGLEAGISNGEQIVVRAAMKPLPTLMKPLDSVDLATGEAAQALVERSDVQAVEALAVVAEAAVAWELAAARRTSSVATRSGTSSQPTAPTSSVSGGRARPGASPRARRVHGRGKDDAGRAGRSPARRRFVDLDREIEARAGATIAELFARDGEAGFRALEEAVADPSSRAPTRRARARRRCRAVRRDRERLRRRAFTVLLDVDPAPPGAGRRAAAGRSPRRGRVPRALPGAPADLRGGRRCARADMDGIVLAAAGVHVGSARSSCSASSSRERAGRDRRRRERGRHPRRHAQLALGDARRRHARGPAGEQAKSIAVLERLWRALRVGRDGTIVALGGGCTTDSPASPRRPTCVASPGSPCRRRSSGRSTRRSAGRRRSTSPAGRISSARSTGRRAS